MSYKILASTVSMDSAMKLRDSLEKLLGMEHKTILVSKDSGNCKGHTTLLRYGCGYGQLFPEPEWSSMDFFDTSIDKAKFVDYFKDVIAVPSFQNRILPKKFPVLIRKTLTGKASEGIVIVRDEETFVQNWNPGYYWTEYFQHEIEIRVYVVLSEKGYDLRIYRKVPREDVPEHTEFICGLNGDDNTAWILKDTKYYEKAVKVIEKLFPKLWNLGGRFAAFDMIYSTERSEYITLEMNSGPWMTKPCADWLAQKFIETQGKKFFNKGV